MAHSCVKCSSSSPITSCTCEKAVEFQKDVEANTASMDEVTTKIKAKPEKSTDLNYARGGWPRGRVEWGEIGHSGKMGHFKY